MAIALTEPAPTVPQPLGACRYCTLTLYADGPLASFADGTISHVACEADARRRADPRSGR